MQSTTFPVLVNAADEKFSAINEIHDLVQHRNLLWNLVHRDLTVRYKRSVIGFFWTMLNPLLLMIILTVVFSTIFRFEGIDNYPTYFLSTYLVFGFFAQTTNQSMASLSWNGALMKRVRVPKSIFAVSTTLSGLVNLCLAYVPLFVIMIATGAPICVTVLYLPISFLLIAMFTLGVSLLLIAFALNLLGRLDQRSRIYQGLNLLGAGVLTVVSIRLAFLPFVVLEGIWALVALLALLGIIRMRG